MTPHLKSQPSNPEKFRHRTKGDTYSPIGIRPFSAWLLAALTKPHRKPQSTLLHKVPTEAASLL
jgi:hypothetical protein